MSATAASAATDRADFPTIVRSGTKVGFLTAAGVVLYLVAARVLRPASPLAQGFEALLVLATGSVAAFLPGAWCAARRFEGIAAAAAAGLWGAVVFAAFDIAVLRPLKAYPWTWDAIGGGSTWWYLPLWWMLGTFLAWMGGIVTARHAGGNGTLRRVAAPSVAGTVIVTALVRLAGLAVPLPVATGGAFTLVLAALALIALARKG